MSSTSPEGRDHWLMPKEGLEVKGSDELMHGVTVEDFWLWGFSDLRMNIVRGVLAEFLVFKAVCATVPETRSVWDNFDVKSPEDIKIEVKSSGYCQSWPQREPSKIGFSGLTGLRWDPDEGWSKEREVRADVFVFAVQTCKDPAKYEPLNVEQWEFYVVTGDEIRDRDTRAVGVEFLREQASGPKRYEELRQAILAADARRPHRGSESARGSRRR